MGQGTEVLFTRLTKFLTVFKNFKSRTAVIKSLKIVYASGFTKTGKIRQYLPVSKELRKGVEKPGK